VAIQYLNALQPDREPHLVDTAPSTIMISGSASAQSSSVTAASGDIEGVGASDLVVGQAVPCAQGGRDDVAVYRIVPDQPPALLQHFAAFDSAGTSGSGNLTVGDVDPSEPGDEIVVGEDGSCQRAVRLRIFGGLATGDLHLLHQLRVISGRTAARQQLSFVLGDVVPNHPGQEIVVGGRRGSVSVYGFTGGQAVRLLQFAAFTDAPRTSSNRIAVGDVLPNIAGEEIIVADDGTGRDGLVRIFDGRTGTMLLEFEAFERGEAPAGVELWAADVDPAFPGAELIAGQGSGGGRIRVFTIAGGLPRLVVEIPDPLHRSTSLGRLLAVGNLLPDLTGNQVVVAQTDSRVPIQVFQVNAGDALLLSSLDVSDMGGQIGAVAVGR
jgi:hypothetical protein